MYMTCLDLEGVLVPEIWIAFAEETGIPELKKTTRDEPGSLTVNLKKAAESFEIALFFCQEICFII